MASSNQLDTTTILLLILGAIILLPLLTMGMGFGGMMGYGGGMVGYGGTTSGWWPFVGMLFPLIFLLILLGGGYLVFRRMSETQTSQDPAMEELRTAYARGDLTAKRSPPRREFEARRERSVGVTTSTYHGAGGPKPVYSTSFIRLFPITTV